MVAILEDSPIPSQRMSSGSSAIFGTGNSAGMKGNPTERPSQKSPISPPITTPAAVPINQPAAILPSDAPKCRASSPLAVISSSARQIWLGAGRNSGSIRRARPAASHSTSSSAKKAHATHGRETGSKPPPRNRTCLPLSRLASTIGHLPVGDLRLLADVRPQRIVEALQLLSRRRLTAVGARDRHRYDLAHPSG